MRLLGGHTGSTAALMLITGLEPGATGRLMASASTMSVTQPGTHYVMPHRTIFLSSRRRMTEMTAHLATEPSSFTLMET
ncbi:hypothetical protein ES703_70011 [subsurface metagenome]